MSSKYRGDNRHPAPPLPQAFNRGYAPIQEYFQLAAQPGEPGTWLATSEIPTSDEIMGVEDDSLPTNKIEGRWNSKDEYLAAHYELLRFDSVHPLRSVVHQIKEHPNEQEAYFNGSAGIYSKVRFIGLTCDIRGVAIRVAFSLSHVGKKIQWKQSKRLISGGLVALTPVNDWFKTKCVMAVIAARPLSGLDKNPPEVDLYFARTDELELDPGTEWIMVEERSSYFEASRHVLKALQKMSDEGNR